MPSPFPGMNPFLEQAAVWNDFHHSLIVELRKAIVPLVPGYFVRIEEQLYIHEPATESRRLLGRAEVGLVHPESGVQATATAVAAAPLQVQWQEIDIERLSRLEIRDRESRSLVTVLEVLSPTNKYAGPDRDQYENKRKVIQASPTHFIEIDLLRGGAKMPMDGTVPCDFSVLVSRYEQRPKADLWPIHLRERLPRIPVPLRDRDAEDQLDLQDILHAVYDAAAYGDYIYLQEPESRLSPADAAWAQQFLPANP